MQLLRYLGILILLGWVGGSSVLQSAARAQHPPDELSLPGLQTDATHFHDSLRRAYPVGLPAKSLEETEATAAAAMAAKDYAKALPALQMVIGGLPQGTAPNAQTWQALAQAELSVSPPQWNRALEAGWMAFTSVDTDNSSAETDQVAALRAMRRALVGLNKPLPEIKVLQAIARRLPQDAAAQQKLVQREQQVGLLFDGLTTNAEAFPTRACLKFVGDPSTAPDFYPGDWVTLYPAVKDAAVTVESRRICITGLPAGATTAATLRHGMPGDNGLSLKQDLTIPIAMPDRTPRLVFDGGRFLQPRDSRATVALHSVNLSAVKLTLVKIGERNLLHVMQIYSPSQGAIGRDGATDLQQDEGRVVWTGRADVAAFARNALDHTVLPLPSALSAPGLYALVAAPGDGTPFAQDEGPVAVQLILRTDLAPTVWHGAGGDTVQVRSYASGLPVAGAAVDLLAADNEILGSATTDQEGVVTFAQPLLAGPNGLAPAALHIRANEDFTRLDLTTPNFDLSDRGASGAPQPGSVDPFIWTDRGIYRPGETVQVVALLRDESGGPVNLPLHLIVTRPDGRVFQDTVPARGDGGSIHQAVTLSPGAQFGTWGIVLKADPNGPAIADRTFQVDAFVPPRLAVSFAPATPKILEPGRTTDLPLDVRFLYGAAGNDLSGSASITVTPNPAPFVDFTGYHFGLADDAFTANSSQVDLPATDANGRTTVPVDLSKLPDTSVALQGAVSVDVNDPAGRGVGASTTLPIRPAAPMIGIAENFSGESVNADTIAEFRLVAVAPDGKRVVMPVQIRLVRQTPDWRLAVSNGQARYETVWRDEPVDSQSVTLPADGAPFAYGRTLPFGRYRLQVLQANRGMATSSVVFYSGWAIGDNPNMPARVSVRASAQHYKPGDTAAIHVEAPYAGPATVLVMTDRVKKLIDVTPSSASFDVSIPVTADWGAGAYVGVHVFRPGGTDPDAKQPPARAIGLTWVALDPAPRTLPLSIETQAIYRPRTTATFSVKTTPGAWVTLAAVDEGILALTDFKTPDPRAHFFGKRRLGVGIHDDWARLLAPAGAANTVLRQGAGGDIDTQSNPIPQQIVSLFAGPVQAGPDGLAQFPLALPDFDGTLRLMAVGWDGTKTGSLGRDITMRDPAIIEPLLPRFLAPGDQARVTIMLQNLELPPGNFSVHVAASGSLSVAGGDPAPLNLPSQQRALVPVVLTANGAGLGTLTIDADGPNGFHVEHTATISVHPARGVVAQVVPVTLAPGASETLRPGVSAFIPGTWVASVSFGLGVRYDPAAMVRALEAYPLDCLEQLASRGLPLAMLSGPVAGEDRVGRLQQVVEALGDRQRYDGAFGLWSSNGDAQPWLTAYATDVLLRARRDGVPVPQPMLDQALGWLTNEVATPPSGADDYAAQAYALEVLSLAGTAPAGAVRVAAQGLGSEPTPLARAQIAASLVRLGQDDQARAIFTQVLADPSRRTWDADFGSALRDQLATAVLISESGVMPQRLPAIRAALPGSDLNPETLNTQEQAWAGAAAGTMESGVGPVMVVADGKTLGPAPSIILHIADATTVHNAGKVALPGSLVVQGVPIMPPPAARSGMMVRRNFYAVDGSRLDADKLPQNSTFVMVIDGEATDGQDHRAVVLAGLPAGWEIAGRFSSGKVPGMDWLGELSETESQAAADDRYAAVVSLTSDHRSFRLAVILRAVTPGSFEYPGITLADMYRPAVFARQNVVRISVTPAAP